LVLVIAKNKKEQDNDEEGKFVAVSIFGVHSKAVRNKLREIL